MTTLIPVPIPGTTATIDAAREGEDILIALRPACEAMGIDYSAQLKRLKGQPWAVVAVTATTGVDGKTYEMATLNRKTFTMWLATLSASRVKNPAAREVLEVFQRDAADALDAYFHRGVAVNAALSDREIVQRALQLVNADLEAANDRIAQLAPRAEYVERYVADEDLRILRNVAKSIGIGEKQLRDALLEHRWIYREDSSRWSEKRQEVVPQTRYSAYAEVRSYFRPVPNHEAPRFRGEVDHTLKITPAGALAIAKAAERWGLTRKAAA